MVGSYGRGLWVTDIFPLQQLGKRDLEQPAHLFEIDPRPVQLTHRSSWGNYQLYGDRHLDVPNRPDGLEIYYHLVADAEGPVELRIERPSGHLLATLNGPAEAGLHRVLWRTRFAESDPDEEPAAAGPDAGEEEDEEEHRPPSAVAPGEVIVILVVDGIEQRRRTRLEESPPMPVVQ